METLSRSSAHQAHIDHEGMKNHPKLQLAGIDATDYTECR